MAIDIANYYEPLVFSAIQDHLRTNSHGIEITDDLLEDAACIALNRLPARYIRHHVDVHFYVSAQERAAMEAAAIAAVREAFEHLGREQVSGPEARGVPGKPESGT